MGNFNLNTESNNYPIILIPEKILKFQKTKFDDIILALFLKLDYPILDLNVYKYHRLLDKKELISTADYLNPDIEIDDSYSNFFIDKYELPKRPKKYKNKVENNGGCLLYLVSILVTAILIGVLLKFSIALLFLLCMFFLGILFQDNIQISKTYQIPIDDKVFKSNYNKFIDEVNNLKDKAHFKYDSLKYEIDKEISSKRNEVENLMFINNLKPLSNINKLSIQNRRGKTELYFLSKLFENFNSQIHMDVIPDIGVNPFQPDFVVICNETGFHIDIEIDEPYSVNNGIPIHHDRSNDEERNRFFLEINWGVVRFSEKQIIENTNECIDLIKNLLFAIKNKKETLNHNVTPQSKWTYEEALIMSNNNFRNTYLPDNMKIKIKYDESNSKFNDYDLPF